MEKFIQKLKVFFTVRNSLITVICILSLILIVQNVNRMGHRPSRNFGGSMTNSRTAGGSRGVTQGFPGMMGGGMGNRKSGD